jgi:DUF1680 family protein
MNARLLIQMVFSLLATVAFCRMVSGADAQPKGEPTNLALYAKPLTSYVSGHESLDALNDGFEPRNSADHRHGAYGNWPQTGTQWVEYDWPAAISTNKSSVYWWKDGQGIDLPVACRLLYWDGKAFAPVPEAAGLGLELNHFNDTTFPEITTTKLRLEFDGHGPYSTGIIEWKVYDSGRSPKFPPHVAAGGDRTVVMPGKTYLRGSIRGLDRNPELMHGPQSAQGKIAGLVWSKASGPGEVTFDDATAAVTAAAFSSPGDYVLKLTVSAGGLSSSDSLKVSVQPPLTLTRLDPVYPRSYKISGAMWVGRMKPLITTWLPHCVDELEDPNLPEGGINNFIEAGKKLAGQPHKPQSGAPWANAYVHNTVESICDALMVDPQGDPQIIASQQHLQATLDQWIPLILSAQEPDGYLQTRFTLGTDRENKTGHFPAHWTMRGEHEGYTAGYFIESAIADYLLTDGKDRRMYEAAKRLADCWDRNIGPAPKKSWFDGHEEIEQALVRFGRFVNDVEGGGKGDRYTALAKFLLDQRMGGSEYDQTHLPVVQQYEAVGHAVRASYLYSAMADVAVQTHDADYVSAVNSLWDNLTNKKWYITGGIGSGETSEGFGKNYSLPNNAYCESCSNCGALFFNWKMNLAYHDAKFADQYEGTLFNAILGDYDLSGANFTYTNALDSSEARYPWHSCPCCVGNFPRTLLMLPTWMYSTGDDGLYVNLYLGSTVTVDHIAGTSVRMVQETDYPLGGKIVLAVNPAESKTFALRLRIPDRGVSTLYTNIPEVNGLTSLLVNGEPLKPQIENGYAVITRQWKTGDKVELDLPMKPYRVKAIDTVKADRGRVALKFGPLVYNIESVDQDIEKVLADDAPLATEFKPDLLGGTLVIKGTFTDGSPMLAIPNYLRLNRGGRSIVWIKDR